MKIFNDHKAQKLFDSTYESMDPMTRSLFGEKCRNLAKDKIESEEGMFDEFYLTVKDIKYIISTIRPFPL